MDDKTTENQDDAEPQEQYDHGAPRPKHPGLAILFSLFIPGGGQFLKGHFTSVFVIWGLMALTYIASKVAAQQEWFGVSLVCLALFALVWIGQLLDAAWRPESRSVE